MVGDGYGIMSTASLTTVSNVNGEVEGIGAPLQWPSKAESRCDVVPPVTLTLTQLIGKLRQVHGTAIRRYREIPIAPPWSQD